MKKQLLFIHSAGAQGKDEGSSGLVAALQKALGVQYDVQCPKMPHPENPRYESWRATLEKELETAEDGVILAGHSLGGSVLLKCLSGQPYKKKISGLFLVATPYWGEKGWEVDEFILQDDFASRLPPIPQIFLYHSLHDPIVSFTHLICYASKLPQAHVRRLEGDEHQFSQGLPELAEDIRNL